MVYTILLKRAFLRYISTFDVKIRIITNIYVIWHTYNIAYVLSENVYIYVFGYIMTLPWLHHACYSVFHSVNKSKTKE